MSVSGHAKTLTEPGPSLMRTSTYSAPSCHRSFVSAVFQARGDDAMLPHTYSLLNYIAAASIFSGLDDIGEIVEGAGGQTDYATPHSVASALRGLTEEEKRLIAVSTISV